MSTDPSKFGIVDVSDDAPRPADATDRPGLTAVVRDDTPDPRSSDPRRPGWYENPAPRDVGAESAHDIVVESLYSLDGRLLRPIRADRYKLLRLLSRDLEDRRDFGLDRYGQTLQPGNGRDTLIDLYQEQLDGLAYAQTLLSEAQDSDAESDAKTLYEAQLVLTLQTRALLARRNGELPGGGTSTPASES
jgi:hypothetical protein